jgi:hypothetical protein
MELLMKLKWPKFLTNLAKLLKDGDDLRFTCKAVIVDRVDVVLEGTSWTILQLELEGTETGAYKGVQLTWRKITYYNLDGVAFCKKGATVKAYCIGDYPTAVKPRAPILIGVNFDVEQPVQPPSKADYYAPGQTTATELAAAVIGLSETQAVARITDAGFVSRIASIDGVAQPGITNMSVNRINLTLEDGVVRAASAQ